MSSQQITETIRADDFVEYYLFPDLSSIDIKDNEESVLKKFLDEVYGSLSTYLNGYIWHKDQFQLIPRWGNSNLLNEDQEEDDGKFLSLISIQT